MELSHPRVNNVIRYHVYVDDVLSGTDYAKDAQLIVREQQSALYSAGFPLIKWALKEISAHIQSGHLLTTDFLEIDTESTDKTLGIRWKATFDEFFFVPTDFATDISPTTHPACSLIYLLSAKIFMQVI